MKPPLLPSEIAQPTEPNQQDVLNPHYLTTRIDRDVKWSQMLDAHAKNLSRLGCKYRFGIEMARHLAAQHFYIDRLMCARKWITEGCYLRSSNRHETAFLAFWMALEAMPDTIDTQDTLSSIRAKFKPIHLSLTIGTSKNIADLNGQFEKALASLLDGAITTFKPEL